MSGPTKDTLQWISSTFVMPLLGACVVIIYGFMNNRMNNLEVKQDGANAETTITKTDISSMKTDIFYIKMMLRDERDETHTDSDHEALNVYFRSQFTPFPSTL